jgi:alpha-galactosidase
MNAEELAFSMSSALLARVHLAGHIDTLNESQLDVVREGIEAYKRLRTGIPASEPSFPLGLPGWRDHWIAQGATFPGIAADEDSQTDRYLIALHRRGGLEEQLIALPSWLGPNPLVSVAYPSWGSSGVQILPGSAGQSAVLKVTMPEAPSARVIELRPV